MNRKFLFSVLFVFTLLVGHSQEESNYLDKGNLTLGLRTTTSLFGHDNIPGLGTGGQFRLQLFDFLSTEWFADWITMDLKGAGTRKNAHIGWSVLFYPKKLNRFTPYLIAGHCFDYAEVIPLSTQYVDRSTESSSRWSSAVQAGLGTHFFLTDRFNMSVAAQYMLHFGQHLGYELLETGSGHYLEMKSLPIGGGESEGHLLLTFSLNYRIADLW
ncbi:hypothetical protein N8987_01015 [Crocinitomix sp.]|nr:hypothetical protein [Crocinitomix sp.]